MEAVQRQLEEPTLTKVLEGLQRRIHMNHIRSRTTVGGLGLGHVPLNGKLRSGVPVSAVGPQGPLPPRTGDWSLDFVEMKEQELDSLPTSFLPDDMQQTSFDSGATVFSNLPARSIKNQVHL